MTHVIHNLLVFTLALAFYDAIELYQKIFKIWIVIGESLRRYLSLMTVDGVGLIYTPFSLSLAFRK